MGGKGKGGRGAPRQQAGTKREATSPSLVSRSLSDRPQDGSYWWDYPTRHSTYMQIDQTPLDCSLREGSIRMTSVPQEGGPLRPTSEA